MPTLEAERKKATPAPKPEALTGYEPCDTCGARAKARASLGELVLFFCAHDIRHKGDALEAKGFEIFPSNWRDHELGA